MEHPPDLRTDRLLLRPFRADDVDDVFAYASGPEWGRHLPVPRPYTRRDAAVFVADVVVADPEQRLEWAIVHEGRVAGGIGLRFRDYDSAELGYSLAPALWGRGLATEAAAAVIGHGFGALDLARIWACADVRNVGSWRVMEKLSMRREGLLRGRRAVHGERVDDVLYAVLREEWGGPA